MLLRVLEVGDVIKEGDIVLAVDFVPVNEDFIGEVHIDSVIQIFRPVNFPNREEFWNFLPHRMPNINVDMIYQKLKERMGL